ncbi:MAG: DUF4118 domain-containing protein [Pseudolabrys sp.]|nr:DUF4118 domain-containing protein [Pseudolabrys sp.]
MFQRPKFPGLRRELRAVLITLCLVAAITAILYLLILTTGLEHGSAAYLVPVLIAAMRWGMVSAVVAAVCGVLASAFFFYPPLYSFRISDPQEVLNLILFVVVAIAVSQLATQLRRQLELARRREIDLRDLYDFSRRLAGAFDVAEIHAAIEEHLAAVLQRDVILYAGGRGAGQRKNAPVPQAVFDEVKKCAAGRWRAGTDGVITTDENETWLVRAVSPKNAEFGVVAINLGFASPASIEEFKIRTEAVLADAAATLERLDVANAIGEARMRAQAEQLREALIESVSHELRTPLASILGAATVLSEAPALQSEVKLRALVQDVRDEAERLNNDIQNLLDATRISSEGVKPRAEWTEPADIIHSALDRCRVRLADRRVRLDIPPNLPLIHVDPVLVRQALVQIIDNAAKYSHTGSCIVISARAGNGHLTMNVSDEGAGLTEDEQARMWDRFERGERHAALTGGSGLGLWIANAFIAANGGVIRAASAGADCGTTMTIELPVTQATVAQSEGDDDE